MSVYDSGRQRMKEMFDSIAPYYDFLNNVISLGQHRRVKQRLLIESGVLQSVLVADLCCGSADISLLLSQMNPNINITAVDFSGAMLSFARAKCKNHKNVSFIQANVMELPFPEDLFDAAVISFGLRNLPDMDLALKEIKRIVKPGGTVVNIDTGKVTFPFAAFLFNFYFFKLMPFLCGLVYMLFFRRLGFSPYAYLAESANSFPAPERIKEQFYISGYIDVRIKKYLFGAISCHIAKV